MDAFNALNVFALFALCEDHGYDQPLTVIFGIRDISPFIEWSQHFLMIHNIKVEDGLVEGVCFFSVFCERFLDLRFMKVEQFDVPLISTQSLLCLLPLFSFFIIIDLCHHHLDSEGRLTLDSLSLLFFLLLLTDLLFHVLHLVSNELFVLNRVCLSHLIQHLPHSFHILLIHSWGECPGEHLC
jgi:hypothetical protein